MRIFVQAHPAAHEAQVKKIDEKNFEVWVTEIPTKGQANMAIIRALADYFKIAPSRIALASGKTTKRKFFELF